MPANLLVDILTTKCRILGTNVRFVPGDLNLAARNPEKYFNASVNIDFMLSRASIGCTFHCSQTDRTIAKRVLRVIDPTLTRGALRAKSVKSAMNKLIFDIREAGKNAIESADKSNMDDRVRKLYKTRHRRELKGRTMAAVQSIQDAIISAPNITMQDLEDIWRNCQARMVMES